MHPNSVEEIQGGVHCEPRVALERTLFYFQTCGVWFIAPSGLHLHDQQSANTSLYPLDTQPRIQGWEATLFTESKTYVS